MRTVWTITSALVFTIALGAVADAAPVVLTLQMTSPLYNEDPPGAPLPLGRTQYDAGDVLYNERKIGEYLRVKDVHLGTLNTAAITLTIFLPNSTGAGAPTPITLQGSHDFTSGEEVGSVSASPLPGLAGIPFIVKSNDLTLFLP